MDLFFIPGGIKIKIECTIGLVTKIINIAILHLQVQLVNDYTDIIFNELSQKLRDCNYIMGDFNLQDIRIIDKFAKYGLNILNISNTAVNYIDHIYKLEQSTQEEERELLQRDIKQLSQQELERLREIVWDPERLLEIKQEIKQKIHKWIHKSYIKNRCRSSLNDIQFIINGTICSIITFDFFNQKGYGFKIGTPDTICIFYNIQKDIWSRNVYENDICFKKRKIQDYTVTYEYNNDILIINLS
jgi:hypothetical protein